MISKELKKILNLVKKTGDRVVVYDAQESEGAFVLMDFNSYENLIKESLVLAKNSEDLNSEKELVLEEKSDNLLVENQAENLKTKELTEEDLTDKINREISLWKNQENQSFATGDQKIERPLKPWSIPSKVKEKAKEVE